MTASASNSETIYAPSSSYYGFTHSVSWSESNPSTSTNKSKISASASLGSSVASFSNNSPQHLSVYWFDNNQYKNGIKIVGEDFYSCGMGYGTESVSGSIEVPHKDDGTLSGYCTSYFTKGDGGWYTPDDNGVSTSTQNLDTIARASTASADPSTVIVGSSGATVTINTNRKASSFTHTLSLTCGEWASTQTGVEASTTFDIPYSIIGQFASNSKTATCTITCTTYNGSTNIGQKTSTFTLQTDISTDHPNIGNINVADANPRTSAVTQSNNIMISNISKLRATIPFTVSGSYTELYEATVTCGNVTRTYVLNGTSQSITFEFDNVNAGSLGVVVKDKRGNTVNKTQAWTLVPYQPITTTATVGRPTATGSVGVGQITGMAYGGNFGATQNSLTVKVDFKKHDDTSYDPQGTETFTSALSQSGYNQYTQSYTFAYALDYQYQYDIRFTVSDLFSTAIYTAQLMQGLPIISWDETQVDIWGNVHIHDRDDPYKYQDILGGFDSVLDNNGAKNLLPNPEVKTTTISGVTFTVNADGSITVNGTASAYAVYTIGKFTAENGVDYILSGCPSGGGAFTYDLGIGDLGTDKGDGFSFRGNGSAYDVTIAVFNGVTVNNIVYKPMIRDARIVSESYVQGALPMIPHYLQYNLSLPANVASGGNRVDVNFSIHGNGIVFMFGSLMDNSNGNYGTMRVGFDYKHADDAWFAMAETLDRNISQGSGQYSARVCSSTATTVSNGDKLRLFYAVSNDGTTHILRSQFVSFGCYVTKD